MNRFDDISADSDGGGEKSPPQVLTIAGSDSGGGAGIQADLKTMTAFRTFGMSVITAVTAQNTLGVQAVEVLEPEFVGEQLDSIFSDFSPAAAKTGMLADADIVSVIADRLERYDLPHLVVDPVMVATSGDMLLAEEAVETVCERLLPLAGLITPNLQEARVLLKHTGGPGGDQGVDGDEAEDVTLAEMAVRLYELGPEAVLIKGGHLDDEDVARDLLYDGQQSREFTAPRLPADNTHGTGCSYAAAIASCLARGMELVEAVERSKQFITAAISEGFRLGAGINPVNHLVRPEGGGEW